MWTSYPPDPGAELLAAVATDPWGAVSASPYDTARLVALAPWLAGHRARVAFLCRTQRPDGGWGAPDGYALVPTLSATTALLAELRRRTGTADGPPPARPAPVPGAVAAAASGGLRALRRWLAGGRLAVPDTIGVELIVPALLEELAGLLSAGRLPRAVRAGADLAGPPGGLRPPVWLRLPAGFDRRLLTAARDRLAAGAAPRKAWVCLEVLGPAAATAPGVHPTGGSVGCSAAATAAWLGGADRDPAAAGFLRALQARGGGPVPGVTPITYFEPAWVLNSLATAGLRPPVPPAVLDRLESGLAGDGAPAAPGLPPDADDTAAVLAALLRHGRVRRPDSLLPYRAGGYFTCFPDERNPSVSTNAHVLEALALYLAARPAAAGRYAAPAATAAGWLLDQQRPDGSWQDKWHASGYYATSCCVLALARYGGPGADAARARAGCWVRDSQRPDGGWGRWQSSVEETAYAVQILAHDPAAAAGTAEALARGHRFLADPPPAAPHPPLWHAKDLYTPVRVVRAAQLAGLHLAADRTHPRLATRAG